MRSGREWAKHLDFILWDVVCLQVALALAYVFRHGLGSLYQHPEYRSLALMYVFLDVVVAILFNTMHNVLKRSVYRELAQSAKQAGLVLLAMALYMFAIQVGVVYSRITVFLTAILHFAIGMSVRLLWRRLLLAMGVGRKRSTMFVIAHERDVASIVRSAHAAGGVAFSGLVLTNRDATGEKVAGIPVVASLETAPDYLVREWVDEVLVYPRNIAVPTPRRRAPKRKDPVADLVDLCCQMGIPVHVRLPFESTGGKSFAEKVAGYNVLTIASNYASGAQMAAKRTMDILGGLVGSLLALLIMLVFGPIIKRQSPGPILFRQERVGLNGKRFHMYKIRTMHLDADARKAELAAQNRVDGGMMFKLDWDPRIIGNEELPDGTRKTGVGELLRRTSLDEFPQFFNVLLGQMSLVGTRPPTVDEWERYQYHHRARLATKPGITGMWQVSGRSEITDFEEVVRLDTEYIRNWSMGLDVRILLKTIRVVFTRRGAM